MNPESAVMFVLWLLVAVGGCAIATAYLEVSPPHYIACFFIGALAQSLFMAAVSKTERK